MRIGIRAGVISAVARSSVITEEVNLEIVPRQDRVFVEVVCAAQRARASFTRDPGGVVDDGYECYCTSTVMVWVAETSL